jgi:hypothetical protein
VKREKRSFEQAHQRILRDPKARHRLRERGLKGKLLQFDVVIVNPLKQGLARFDMNTLCACGRAMLSESGRYKMVKSEKRVNGLPFFGRQKKSQCEKPGLLIFKSGPPVPVAFFKTRRAHPFKFYYKECREVKNYQGRVCSSRLFFGERAFFSSKKPLPKWVSGLSCFFDFQSRLFFWRRFFQKEPSGRLGASSEKASPWSSSCS